jgi:hypothetical protein
VLGQTVRSEYLNYPRVDPIGLHDRRAGPVPTHRVMQTRKPSSVDRIERIHRQTNCPKRSHVPATVNSSANALNASHWITEQRA